MIGLKRFVRPDLVFSAIGHVGVLLLGLLVFGGGADRRVPPEAMTVEIVPPSEAPQFDPPTETPQPETPQAETPQAERPQFDGTPLESKSTGSEVSSNSEKGSASAEPPRPKAARARRSEPHIQAARSHRPEPSTGARGTQ